MEFQPFWSVHMHHMQRKWLSALQKGFNSMRRPRRAIFDHAGCGRTC
jgi:hypothetical protein